jgi:hypothetical protein
MERTLHSLQDFRAKRSGEVTYVHFIIEGDQVTVAIDDIGSMRWSNMSREQARVEYAEWLARGLVPYKKGDPDKLIRYIDHCNEWYRNLHC